jgi:hypothetical protein
MTGGAPESAVKRPLESFLVDLERDGFAVSGLLQAGRTVARKTDIGRERLGKERSE